MHIDLQYNSYNIQKDSIIQFHSGSPILWAASERKHSIMCMYWQNIYIYNTNAVTACSQSNHPIMSVRDSFAYQKQIYQILQKRHSIIVTIEGGLGMYKLSIPTCVQ